MSSDDPRHEALLRKAWEAARAQWPGVDFAADDFARYVIRRMERGEKGVAPAEALGRLVLGDLYLAGACVQDVAGACAALEEQVLTRLPGLLNYLKLSETRLDEVCQQVRIHLLMGTNGKSPRLAEYNGRGSLLSWIRVMAVRMALKQGAVGREVSEESESEAFRDMPSPDAEPELGLIKRHSHHEFNRAVREAFATLSPEQRHLLKLHFIDKLSMTEMGRLFRKNQSTVSRWLQGSRAAIFNQTKSALKARMGMNSSGFRSLLDLVRSQMDVNIGKLLRERPTGGSEESQ